jgi:hypothetical protein
VRAMTDGCGRAPDHKDASSHLLHSLPPFPPRSYGPGGFNFGGDDSAPPIVDNPQSPEYNVPDRIAAFISTIQSFVNFTRPNKDGSTDVMIMMATDFSYEVRRLPREGEW